MIREAIATGDTVDKAFENACKELGVESYEAEFEVLKFPEKKILGLFGGSPAEVRAFIKTSPADVSADYLRNIFKHMGLNDIEVQVVEEENGAKFVLSGDELGFMIGHRGETLDALQYLVGLVANHVDNSYYRIMLDVGNYREKRKETLKKLGKRMAEKAVRNKRNFSLEPMNPYERRIIHTAVQEVEGAKSWSEGEESARHVVVGPADGEVAPKRRYDNKGKGNYRGGRGGGRKKGGSGSGGKTTRPAETAEKPVENKTDSGATQLYGKIEVK